MTLGRGRLRLLHVVPTYLPATRYGGPIHSVHGLCRALAARGHEVHVFTTSVDGAGDSDVPLGRPVVLDGVRVWYFPVRRLRRLYWSPPMWRALVREAPGFDLVHLHSVFLWPTWAAARVALRVNVPYVLSPRGMLVSELIQRRRRWIKTAWIRLIERDNIEQASAVHVTSAVEAQELGRFGFRLPPVWEIPNGVDEPQPWSPAALSAAVAQVLAGPAFLLMLGRVSWKKGIDLALRVLPHVSELPLIVSGNDDEGLTPRLQALAAALGVAARTRFLGAVGGADKEALLDRATLLVLPSYSENFGNVVLEALAHGCPVVTTPEVGAARVVVDSGGGVVVPGEPALLGPALASLVADPALAEMGRTGREHVLSKYSWSRIAERMEALYAALAQRGG